MHGASPATQPLSALPKPAAAITQPVGDFVQSAKAPTSAEPIGMRSCLIPRRQAAGQTPPFLFGPAESLQVATVPVVELDAFLFQQALLQIVAAIA
jgi:hypothetical protein